MSSLVIRESWLVLRENEKKCGIYFVARGLGHVPRKKKYGRTPLIDL